LKSHNVKCVLAAGDTFRAAAVQQIVVWGDRIGCEVIRGKDGADPGSVVFDAIKQAEAADADVVLADTAGRLHTKSNLMSEMKKIAKTAEKAIPGAPHEILLVIDATNGQNALAQAREFRDALPLTGIVLTKLDGTAKGGVVLGIAHELRLPVRYIGLGERPGDLHEFNADQFVEALLGREAD
jgi:fused signal recognition particle receptor